MSCGEDKNWMIWDVQDKTYEKKGMISGQHSRAIYSCSWSKGTKAPEGKPQLDLIATVSVCKLNPTGRS